MQKLVIVISRFFFVYLIWLQWRCLHLQRLLFLFSILTFSFWLQLLQYCYQEFLSKKELHRLQHHFSHLFSGNQNFFLVTNKLFSIPNNKDKHAVGQTWPDSVQKWIFISCYFLGARRTCRVPQTTLEAITFDPIKIWTH